MSDPVLAIEGILHDTELTAGVSGGVGGATEFALIFTTKFPCDALLAIVRRPANAFACTELNCSVRVAVCPGFRVVGAVIPLTVNDAPVTVRAEISAGAVPVELSVTD